jgi:hypothetical protein
VISVLKQCALDAVIAVNTFLREFGEQLRSAVEAVHPGLPIAVITHQEGDIAWQNKFADVSLRPTRFFTDLKRYTSPSNCLGSTAN